MLVPETLGKNLILVFVFSLFLSLFGRKQRHRLVWLAPHLRKKKERNEKRKSTERKEKEREQRKEKLEEKKLRHRWHHIVSNLHDEKFETEYSRTG